MAIVRTFCDSRLPDITLYKDVLKSIDRKNIRTRRESSDTKILISTTHTFTFIAICDIIGYIFCL